MTRFAVVDTETTGTEADSKIVEFAAVLWNNGEEKQEISFLINPSVAIPPQASAIHHLTSKHLEKECSYSDGMDRIAVILNDADYIVAHNAAFDSRYVPDVKKTWLCTYRLARHVFPDAPSYGNQVLRYYLGLEMALPIDLAPHRALYDSLVTAELFEVMLRKVGLDELVRLNSLPILHKIITFGKYAGNKFETLPLDYLFWLNRLPDKDDDFKYTVRYYIEQKKTR